MNAPSEKGSITAWLRDRAYDVVFEIGDTSLQFIADLIRGSDNIRQQGYIERQMDLRKEKREREEAIEKEKASSEYQTARQNPEDLNFTEKQQFIELCQRRQGESIIEHWKRRKYFIAHPQKKQLLEAELSVEAQEKNEHKITVENRSLSKQYVKNRLQKNNSSRVRERKRKRGRSS